MRARHFVAVYCTTLCPLIVAVLQVELQVECRRCLFVAIQEISGPMPQSPLQFTHCTVGGAEPCDSSVVQETSSHPTERRYSFVEIILFQLGTTPRSLTLRISCGKVPNGKFCRWCRSVAHFCLPSRVWKGPKSVIFIITARIGRPTWIRPYGS